MDCKKISDLEHTQILLRPKFFIYSFYELCLQTVQMGNLFVENLFEC